MCQFFGPPCISCVSLELYGAINCSSSGEWRRRNIQQMRSRNKRTYDAVSTLFRNSFQRQHTLQRDRSFLHHLVRVAGGPSFSRRTAKEASSLNYVYYDYRSRNNSPTLFNRRSINTVGSGGTCPARTKKFLVVPLHFLECPLKWNGTPYSSGVHAFAVLCLKLIN